jgi:hypothetical protein
MATATLEPKAQPSEPWVHPADDTEWDVRDNVPIFEAHDDVDVQRLQRIADKMNARANDMGDGCPLVIGHTVEDAPEWQQPPIVGYTDRYRIGGGRRGIPTLFCREKLYPESDVGGRRYSATDIRRMFPRRSVEFLPDDDVIDPVSMLGARTPRQDLPMVRHAAAKRRLRFAYDAGETGGGHIGGAERRMDVAGGGDVSMKDAGVATPEKFAMDEPLPAADTGDPDEPLVGEMPPGTPPPAPGAEPPQLDAATVINAFREFLAQLDQMAGGNPAAAGAAAAPPTPAVPAGPPMPPEPGLEKPPTEEVPTPEETDREMYEAAVAAATGGANAGHIPGMAGKEKEKMTSLEERVKYSRLEARMAELEKHQQRLSKLNDTLLADNTSLRRKYQRAEAQKRFQEMEAEGIQLDVTEETELVAPIDLSRPAMNDEQLNAHCDRIKKRFARNPGGDGGFVRTAHIPDGGRPKGAAKDLVIRATKLATTPGWVGGFDTALAKLQGGA